MRARVALSLVLVAALLIAVSLSGCTAARPADQPVTAPAIVRVPADEATISAAVSAANEGDTVLVAPGVYRETVAIDTPGITLRGEDRNVVVIDGEMRRGNGVVVSAPGVTVQNLTVRRATQNGVLVTGMRGDDGTPVGGHDGYRTIDTGDFPLLDGFRIDHVTASNNGLYGIYAFNSANGVISDSYASGGADSGIYVGQCDRCGIVVSGNVAERNAVGFEIANAGGGLIVTGNRFVGNRVGATVASDYQEAYVPQRAATLVGNVIAANAEIATPAQADGAFGIGVGIAGGTENELSANLIQANPTAGVILTSAEDLGPESNRITRNALFDNGVDLVFAPRSRAPGSGNCWEGNDGASTAPVDLQSLSPCSAPTAVDGAEFAPGVGPVGIPFSEVAAPPAQPDLGPIDAPLERWRGSDDVPRIDVDGISAPAPDLLADHSAIRW
ncbi:right-handed parallel beta-helix repeat-containing protein [Microbacterium hydrocarbonoxydans]|uniref:right-handed parallel beta-helix repeat-containing protein n=1 Tax=Microbacterium hydrocarbonoxydans TaxID=273678 RepID=UPI00203B0975|nr:right-handed parallel beta-helix repeat-containing protein [Microbacterium hydrocarbonoxydans]MCM3778753.1 right-handed parallel beta-helix repeat-containing protein [Microbacterium hydrocarbonoxydans]